MLRNSIKSAMAAVGLATTGLLASTLFVPALGQQKTVISQAVMAPAMAPGASASAGATQKAALVAPETLTQDAARSFIEALGQRTLGALRVTGLTTEQRTAELGLILLDGVDFDTISMLTLGRYGRRGDSKEFTEFSTLFAAYIIDMAVEKFGAMPIDAYTVTSTTPMPNGDIVVQTSVASTTTINAGWRVRLVGGEPKIVDIVVDGYSMTTHFAGQFQDWLSKAGLEGLVAKMRSQTRNSLSLVVVRALRGES